MRSDDELLVWYRNEVVGTLWENELGEIGFRYHGTWQQHGFPISQQLPLSTKEQQPHQKIAHQFFANLLPEEDARQHIIKDLKIPDSDFELLRAIGGECAGALSILPHNIIPSQKLGYEALSAAELKNLLLRKGKFYSNQSSDFRPRLSLAGAQDKCPIYIENEKYYLPNYSAPSTHILKFALPSYANVPLYECFLATLAQAIDLPVAETEWKQIDKHAFIIVKRFDRIRDASNQVIRLHQEDFCQVLGISHHKKYEQYGGPEFKTCFHALQSTSINPITDAENLLRWLIFNYLAGNSDAHAKNIALVYNTQNQPQLAPFYDLVCTRAITRIDTRLAMSIGGEFHPDKITLQHWHQLADDCDLKAKYLTQLLNSIANQLLERYPIAAEQFEAKFGPQPALQRVKRVVTKQCVRLLKQL